MAFDDPETKPPLLAVGPDNQGPTIVITAYVLVVISILVTLVRLFEPMTRKRSLNAADALVIAGSLIALAQTITIDIAVGHGLGQHFASIPDSTTETYYHAIYASTLLAIPAMTCAKASVVHFVGLLAPHYLCKSRIIIAVAVGLWATFSVLALALQCGTGRPWVFHLQRCSNGGLMYAVTVLNMLTDLYLALFFIPTIWALQMSFRLRFDVFVLFGSRLLVCMSEIAQLVLFPNALGSVDQTWSQAPAVIVAQITLNLSLMTANAPALKRFLYDLQSGQSGTHLSDRQFELETMNSSRKNSAYQSTSAGTNLNSSRRESEPGRSGSWVDVFRRRTSVAPSHFGQSRGVGAIDSHHSHRDADSEDGLGILRTVDVVVEYGGEDMEIRDDVSLGMDKHAP